MDFRVILTEQALDDLREIAKFIAKDDRNAAVVFGEKLIDKSLSLHKLPLRGRIVPEYNDPTIREIPYRPYRIIYQVDEMHCEVYVVRFWHAARGEPEF